MKANTNSGDPNSWAYWVNTHSRYCPHNLAYFLAWHRGFLFRFEARLRMVSADPTLVLPYWNYYTSPSLPSEFLDPSLPLYRADRTGTDVTGALSLDAFADNLIYFQRGVANAFEPIVESRPHNRVHNLIGGTMASVSISPRDPVFWVHHANIDRLWVAWLAAGGGRSQPAASNAYWSGDFQYGANVKTMPRVWTTSTSTYLGYQYDNITMPTAPSDPPPPTSTATASAFGLAAALPLRPASIPGAPIGQSRPLTLDEHSVSVEVPLSTEDANRIRSLLLRSAQPADSSDTGPVRVVLDGVHLTGLGAKGGYFYDVYVNLPEEPGLTGPTRNYLLGSLGSFEVSVAQMKASMGSQGMQDHAMPSASGRVRLVFPATEALRSAWPANLDAITVSFVRVNGRRNPTRGETIRIDAFSVEADPR